MGKIQRFTDAGINILDAFIGNLPDDNPKTLAIKGLWFAIFSAIQVDKALFGKDEMEELGKALQEKTIGKEELFNSPEFQQGLLVTLETHSRTRDIKKRKFIRQVFTEGYLSADSLHEFELERFNTTANRISVPAMQFLKLIDEKLLPTKEKDVQKKVKETNKLDFVPDSYTYKDIWQKSPTSNYVRDWLKSEYDPSDPRMMENHSDLPDKKSSMPYKENLLRMEIQINEFASELISLGVFLPISVFDGIGFEVSDFGREFIKYLRGISFEPIA